MLEEASPVISGCDTLDLPFGRPRRATTLHQTVLHPRHYLVQDTTYLRCGHACVKRSPFQHLVDGLSHPRFGHIRASDIHHIGVGLDVPIDAEFDCGVTVLLSNPANPCCR